MLASAAFWSLCVFTAVFLWLDHRPSDFEQVERIPLWLIIWCSGSVLVGNSAVVLVATRPMARLYFLLHAPFVKLLRAIELEGNIDWDALGAEVHASQLSLCKLLHLREAGAPCMALLITASTAIALAGLLVLIAGSQGAFIVCISVYMFAFGSALILGTLYMLSSSTQLVKDGSAGARSVLAAARRHPSRLVDACALTCPLVSVPTEIAAQQSTQMMKQVGLMSDGEKSAHSRFLETISNAPLGAEIFGISMTKQLFLGAFARVVVYLPTGLAILRSLLDKV